MTLPTWGLAAIGGLVLGGAAVGFGSCSYINRQRAELRTYQDSVQVVHVRDSTAFAVRDSTLQATVRAAIDSARAKTQLQTDSATQKATQARVQARLAVAARDSALKALKLTADQFIGVQAALAVADSANARERQALLGQVQTAQQQFAAEVHRSAQLMADTTDLRSELRKRDAMITGLNARITAALKPVGFGVSIKGGLVGVLVGAGGTCLLTQCWKPR